MNYKKAINILNLKDNFSIEELKKSYYKQIIINHPDKFTNSSIQIREKQVLLTQEINSAYRYLLSNIYKNENINFGFGFNSNYNNYEYTNDYFELQELWHTCLNLQSEEKFGLSIRLFEIGINLCFTRNYHNCHRLYQLQRDLGTMLIDLGLITEGIEHLKKGKASYYLAQTYLKLKDYDKSIFYSRSEIQEITTAAPAEISKLNIAKCFYLKGDLRGCLGILGYDNFSSDNLTIHRNEAFFIYEEFKNYSQKICLMFLISIYQYFLSNGEAFNKRNIYNKFPILKKIIKNSNLNINLGIKKILDSPELLNNKLKKELHLKYSPIENPDLDYNEIELKIILKRIFGEIDIYDLKPHLIE